MEDNPYSKMLGIMRRQSQNAAPVIFNLGLVLSVHPLCVQVDGLKMSGAELLVNPQLLKGYKRKILATGIEVINPPGTLPDCQFGSEYIDDGLQAGDEVALLTLDGGQKFIVLCKVVSA